MKKILNNLEELKNILNTREGKKIVFTNGCFDIIHRGHVEYLQKAKELGDILILGLNSDDSVRRLKGASRPINNETDRAIVLSALECIDYVVIFDEDTPLELIKFIQPDILVKGREYAKQTVLIDFVNGYSTTNIIKKININ